MNRVKYELFVDSICGDVVKWMCVKKLYYNGKFAYNNCCSIILESFCSRDYKTEIVKNTGKFLIIQHPSIRSVRVLEDNLLKYTPWTSLSKFYKFFNSNINTCFVLSTSYRTSTKFTMQFRYKPII